MLKSFLKDPLLHFTLAGGLLFAASVWLGDDTEPPADTVRVDAAELERLSTLWARQWNRTPTQEEQRGLIKDHLKETLLAREAVALGLDQNDSVIQRRLAQKMAFLLEDTLRTANPSDAVLQAFYQQHPVLFQAPAQISFTQHFFASEAAARRGLEILQQDANAEVGEPMLLDEQFHQIDQPLVANLFGAEFAGALPQLPLQQWAGPVASGYGFHLVRVEALQPARLQAFAEVKEKVRDEWIRQEQEKAEHHYFAELLDKYNVELDAVLRPLLADDRLTQVAP